MQKPLRRLILFGAHFLLAKMGHRHSKRLDFLGGCRRGWLKWLRVWLEVVCQEVILKKKIVLLEVVGVDLKSGLDLLALTLFSIPCSSVCSGR